MFGFPVRYEEPLFRPPSEAHSAIVQATIGCAWNKCAFCDMYEGKTFRSRPIDEIDHDLKSLSQFMPEARKVFLADGNAFALSYDRLVSILSSVRKHFPSIRRVSAYALPSNVLSKQHEELVHLKEMGLSLLYLGVESGDDDVLRAVNKSETRATIREGIAKAHAAGLDTSVMIITGLGGAEYSEQHALMSAQLVSELSPKYLSTLTLFLPRGLDDYLHRFKGNFVQQSTIELLHELRLFVSHLIMSGCIFRSNHVSNTLRLEGIVSRDNPKLLAMIDDVIASEELEPTARFSPYYGY